MTRLPCLLIKIMFCILITLRRIYYNKFPLRFPNVLKMSITKLNDFAGFKKVLKDSKKIVVLTGAGISAESGIPVFRGAGGIWRTYNVTELANLGAFQTNPSLVWEFYNYRRNIAFNAQPNKAHLALAKLEEECKADPEKDLHIITQNVDGLHTRAGNKNVIELHGSLREVKCINPKCKTVEVNLTNPIVEAFRDKGDPSTSAVCSKIPISALPNCKKCHTLVRPNIVWFGENLSKENLNKSKDLLQACDLCLVIGTSMVVYPAAEFAPMVANAGKAVAEFNITNEPSKDNFYHHFQGQASVTVPKALGYDNL